MTKIIEYEAPPVVDPEVYRFSKQEYYRLHRSGFFPLNLKTELVYGKIVRLLPKGKKHRSSVNRSVNYLFKRFQGQYTIQSENSIDLPDSNVPEPDVVVCTFREDGYYEEATPSDIRVLLEMSDSSLSYDQRIKLALYARAGIAEYWIINLKDDYLEVYTQPDAATQKFARSAIFKRGEQLSSPALGTHLADH